jgi:murein DD-endopeptidase MepM/ murein hydrolase activator NlpD
VKAIKRAIAHAQRLIPWAPEMWDDVYDDETAHGDGSRIDRSGVAGFQRQMGISPTGWVGKATFEALRTSLIPNKPGIPRAGQPLFDSTCVGLLEQAATLFAPGPALAFPLPQGVGATISPSRLHITAGLDGNWALDFMAVGGTAFVAFADATVRKLSGRDPALGADQVIGIFGWSIHLETADGYRYFATHLGERAKLSVGQRVKIGDALGKVGNWPGDPARSHLHLGVTSPMSEADAKARIQAVASAPRLKQA